MGTTCCMCGQLRCRSDCASTQFELSIRNALCGLPSLSCVFKQTVEIVFSFVCHYWQWPILINCVMCYYLCVLRWLMRSILALNCLLQIKQGRSEERRLCLWRLSSGFPLCTFLLSFADSFCFVCTSTSSYEASPFWSCAICSHDSVSMLRLSLYRFFWPPWERFPTCSSP